MTRFYHGGVPGLRLDDRLLPPAVTGIEKSLTATAQELGASPEHARRDRVYVTTSRDVARVYAALAPDGALYEVLPVDELTPDPDCLAPGVSWMCKAAVVVRIVDPVVLLRTRPFEAWMRMLNRAAAAASREANR
ncbi:hypothetical protein AQJ30_15810 [Streptomyces longwoodensis]|uniref:Uncharacterized protein n=1 Tax=Streptomyces longwoodensis TaxID=68231 RepID=A0A101QXD8_9ACTN|nr:hypothetical protein [Streptomyces longwoodensis]KUN37748.1 hypothetical protein AQJ30_15810 [Streptomyces longwoodensis]